MIAKLTDGPLAGDVYPGLHGGDSLERTVHALSTPNVVTLARYERTGDTEPVPVEHKTREGVKVKMQTADLFRLAELRTVERLRPMDHSRRREPRPGEQMALAM